MRIGQVAKSAGVHIETIRFYERKGLIAQPPRNNGGYRQYPQEAVARIRFIKRAKDLGFSLTEIAELLSFQANPMATCADVKQRAEAKILAIQERVKDLQTMKHALGKLVESCSGSGSLDHCPIIDCFEIHKEKEESP
ncbi:MAG: Hg(II)-responsive transcriptional regulator [Nitrospirales bacterium]|nr:MAG: Hg(II)-responsive transcriptional regulator [Nitrospirales bacterium]